MKFFTPLAAIIAAASAGQIYANQRAENYNNAAEIYESPIEYQQHGLYSDQSQAYHSSPAVKAARILSYNLENDGHSYQFSYETENGIKTHEGGVDQGKGLNAQGAYSYTGDDGHEYTISYTADEHGFRPQGLHLPTPPPVPEAIAKALEQNARDEAAGVYDDGHYEEPKYHSEYQVASHHSPALPTSAYHHK